MRVEAVCKCGALLYSMLDNIDNLYCSYCGYDGDDFLVTVEITPELIKETNKRQGRRDATNDNEDGTVPNGVRR
jgi:hypothetical protein